MLSFINSLTKTLAPNLAVLLALPMGFEEFSCVTPLKQKENTHPHNDLKTGMTRKVNYYFWRLVICISAWINMKKLKSNFADRKTCPSIPEKKYLVCAARVCCILSSFQCRPLAYFQQQLILHGIGQLDVHPMTNLFIHSIAAPKTKYWTLNWPS